MLSYRILIFSLFINCLMSADMRPLSMQPFDVESSGIVYGRGSYLIVLPDNSLYNNLVNENYGGDFIKFKKTQGFNVDVMNYNEICEDVNSCNADSLKAAIWNYYDRLSHHLFHHQYLLVQFPISFHHNLILKMKTLMVQE